MTLWDDAGLRQVGNARRFIRRAAAAWAASKDRHTHERACKRGATHAGRAAAIDSMSALDRRLWRRRALLSGAVARPKHVDRRVCVETAGPTLDPGRPTLCSHLLSEVHTCRRISHTHPHSTYTWLCGGGTVVVNRTGGRRLLVTR